MDALTIHEAAATTGWSARMLRYVERVGLVEPTRSPSGYRLYGPAELQRLRTLRELLDAHGSGAVRRRVRRAAAHDAGAARLPSTGWLEAKPERPADVAPPQTGCSFEQDKHSAPARCRRRN